MESLLINIAANYIKYDMNGQAIDKYSYEMAFSGKYLGHICHYLHSWYMAPRMAYLVSREI